MKQAALPNPFPGLRAFSKEEAHLFFGRKKHIASILQKLARYRFVSIVGNSGSGKSSLVRAGVLPELIRSDSDWHILTIRPGRFALHELCEAIIKHFPSSGNLNEADAYEMLNTHTLGLVQMIRLVLPQGKKLLILVDQFEEIFRFRNTLKSVKDDQESGKFVSALVAAIHQQDVPIYLMLTLRSDFLGDCEQFEGLPEAINDGQFLIPRMNKEELQESISGPVAYAGGKISPRLVQMLVNEIGSNQDQLPVLQHALMRTWELWLDEYESGKPIDISHYMQIGGLENALSRHAEEAYAELPDEKSRLLAANIFKSLTLKGPDNRGVRRPTSIEMLASIACVEIEDIMEVVEIFRKTGRGFLMPPDGISLKRETVIDISHESFMRVWTRLTEWVNEEAESAALYTRICDSAVLFEQGKAGLWRDPDLQIALDWRNHQMPNEYWAKQYNDRFSLAIHFIEASSDDREFVLKERQRRKTLTRVVVSVFIFILSGLSFWAVSERNNSLLSEERALQEKGNAQEQSRKAEYNFQNAEQQKQRAESQKLEAEKQRKIAISKAQEARLQGLIAERASLAANDARKRAEYDKQIALLQKQISDSLKIVAENSEKNVFRLRILSISQNLAIKSAQIQKGNFEEEVKPLLALQASKFNQVFKGKSNDPEIINALQLANKSKLQKPYYHRVHDGSVYSVAVSKNGLVASCGEDGTIVLAHTENMGNTKSSVKQPYILKNLVFNESGNKVLACTDNKSMLVYEVEKIGDLPKIFPSMHSDQVIAFLWPKGLWISIGLDKKLYVVDDQNGRIHLELNLPERVFCMSRMAKTGDLLMGCESGHILYYRWADSRLFTLTAGTGRIQSMAISGDGQLLACGKSDGKIILYDWKPEPENGEVKGEQILREKYIVNAHSGAVTALAFHPNSSSLASASLDGLIKIWNPRNADAQALELKEHENWIWAIAYAPDGDYLVSGGKDKLVESSLICEEALVKKLQSQVKRNLTPNEWVQFIGSDIPYEKTLAE